MVNPTLTFCLFLVVCCFLVNATTTTTTTTTTVLWPFASPCKYELEYFVGAKFYCPRALAEGYQRLRKGKKMLALFEKEAQWIASVVVPDYGLHQLAASSYQECKRHLHNGALLTMGRQCGTVYQQHCQTAACHCTYSSSDWKRTYLQHVEHQPALLQRLSLAPLYKTLDYLLTYLLIYLIRSHTIPSLHCESKK